MTSSPGGQRGREGSGEIVPCDLLARPPQPSAWGPGRCGVQGRAVSPSWQALGQDAKFRKRVGAGRAEAGPVGPVAVSRRPVLHALNPDRDGRAGPYWL